MMKTFSWKRLLSGGGGGSGVEGGGRGEICLAGDLKTSGRVLGIMIIFLGANFKLNKSQQETI